MRYFLDTEFNGLGGQLISLALAPENPMASSLYLADHCEDPDPWVKENVIPIIGVHAPPIWAPHKEFGHYIARFLAEDPFPVIIADWPDDIRYFCGALTIGPGKMVNIRNLEFKLVRVDSYPTTLHGAVQHNALWDAMALRHMFISKRFAEF